LHNLSCWRVHVCMARYTCTTRGSTLINTYVFLRKRHLPCQEEDLHNMSKLALWLVYGKVEDLTCNYRSREQPGAELTYTAQPSKSQTCPCVFNRYFRVLSCEGLVPCGVRLYISTLNMPAASAMPRHVVSVACRIDPCRVCRMSYRSVSCLSHVVSIRVVSVACRIDPCRVCRMSYRSNKTCSRCVHVPMCPCAHIP
jgi:hypothetical protein